MIKGSCLCGAVRWQIDGAIMGMTHCHCSMCRKAHGAPFATYAGVSRDTFTWTSGEASIAHHESSPGFIRSFCPTCGSVVPGDEGGRDVIAVPAGCLDDDCDLGVKVTAHIFVAHAAPWYEITDDLPRHDAYPESWGRPVVAGPTPDRGRPGALRGSCLCGAVAYEVRGEIKAVHSCHCSRCRKARAAAHNTNGFAAIDDVEYVRGADQLVSYQVPDARFFTQTFCRTCGSGLPRLDTERGVAVIPFGSLDDDPGRGADDHIFVGSKASWFEITDDLPQFAEVPG